MEGGRSTTNRGLKIIQASASRLLNRQIAQSSQNLNDDASIKEWKNR